MLKIRSLALAVPACASLGAAAQQGPVLFYGIMELSGTGATPGNNFDNGEDQLRFGRHADESGRREGRRAEGDRFLM